jgi:gamma-glutamylaminecyclotransferase
MPLHFLFVYGTLKRGQPYHDELRGARFVRNAVTVAAFRLHDLGPFPCLVRAHDGVAIRGELFELTLTELERLDGFEGSDYRREHIELVDVPEPVYAYLYLGDPTRFAVCGDEWPPRPRAEPA